jgi:hypothetical protein
VPAQFGALWWPERPGSSRSSWRATIRTIIGSWGWEQPLTGTGIGTGCAHHLFVSATAVEVSSALAVCTTCCCYLSAVFFGYLSKSCIRFTASIKGDSAFSCLHILAVVVVDLVWLPYSLSSTIDSPPLQRPRPRAHPACVKTLHPSHRPSCSKTLIPSSAPRSHLACVVDDRPAIPQCRNSATSSIAGTG